MNVSVPAWALGEEPVTGASINVRPRSSSASPIESVAVGPIVEQSTNIVPVAACVAAPSSPSRTSRTWGPSTTIVMTISAPAPARAGVSAATAPCSSANPRAVDAVRFQTVSSWPARLRLAAIRDPMIPRPRKAILVIVG
jgi:hypothetical protein